ncbi:LysM peptidoglycan-binding domain-containing protein [Methylomagnum sp.]
MRRQPPEARLLCYASIIALSLVGCSQHGGKLKNDSNITDNGQPASTSDSKKSRLPQSAKNSGRLLRKKDRAVASKSGGTKSSSHYDNLWDRLFDLYDLPPIEHEDIDRELNWFVNHPTYIDRVQNRAEPFLYSIVKQVEKQDIPGEIALLPVIESAFQPHAISPANAAGIWQFIPSTGRMYGLKHTRTYDGRRDIYASTRAAIKYLKKLHKEFNGDWLLAIAAYNCGEGAVGRSIQKNLARGLPTDFWSLDLPQETRSYVPRLLAVAKLFSSADQYGVDLHHIPNSAQFKPVKVTSQLDLALAADAADISLDKLRELNPGFKGKHTDIEGSYHLFIPAEKKTAEFRQELERLVMEHGSYEPSRSISEAVSSTLEAKETPVVRAESTELASSLIRTANVDRDFDAASLRERKEAAREKELAKEREQAREEAAKERELAREREQAREEAAREEELAREREQAKERLHAKEEAAKERESAREKEHARDKLAAHHRERDEDDSKSSSKLADKHKDRHSDEADEDRSVGRAMTKKGAYTVQPGETLWAVARKHSVDVEQLAKWNNFSEKTAVKAGQTLVVWNKDAAKKLTLVKAGFHPSQSINNYTVREGDTLFSISRRFKVSVADLRKWNGSNVEKQMQPGRNITVQKD